MTRRPSSSSRWSDGSDLESVPKGGVERRKGMNAKPYPSDLTDQQWAILKPFLPPARTGGRPRKPTCGPWLMPSSTATAMAVSGEPCPTISPHGGPSTTSSRRGNETAPGKPSMTPSAVESGDEPVGSPRPVPAASIARPSRRPRGVASMVTTVPSGSRVGSTISPWIP